MRSRPDVEIRIPKVAYPGDKVAIDIVIEPLSETPIDFIELRFAGDEVTFDPYGNSVRRSHPILERRERLSEATTLVPGTIQHRVNVRIPSDAPASYVGVHTTIAYHARLYISIPWWPDLHESAELTVRTPQVLRDKPVPATKSGRRADGAVIDLSLSDTAFAPGDEIAGAFAVGDLPRQDGLEVELALVAIEETTFEQRRLRAEPIRHLAPTVFRAPRGGVEVPFRFRVPKDATPSFKSPVCELRWLVQGLVRMGSSVLCDVALPVTVRRFNAPAGESADHPQIGTQKWRALWREIGEPRGLSLAQKRLSLVGERGDVAIRIDRDDDGGTPLLVATLTYPSLAIALRVERKTFLLRESPVETRLGGRHEIESRVPAQAEAFFTRRLVESLRRFKELSLGDEQTVVRAPGSGLEPKILSDFVANTLSLAKALSEASEAVPPPVEMTDALPAWQSFAASTGGRLSIGGMALHGASVDGALFDVATRFSEEGVPNATEITLPLDPPLDRAYDLRYPDPWAPPGAREMAQEIRKDAALTIEPTVLRLSLVGITPDPSDLRPRMGQMILLARRLRGERTPGPYR